MVKLTDELEAISLLMLKKKVIVEKLKKEMLKLKHNTKL